MILSTRRRAGILPVILFLTALLAAGVALADESFGRNKVQYEVRDWRVFETANFRIYFADGYEELARFGGQILEDSYASVRIDLGQDVIERVPIIIYPSPGDFRQTNVTLSILGEGTGGFTESFKTRVVIPFNGSYEDFRHVIVHEMAHAITFDLLLGRKPATSVSNRIFELPLWMAEGISEWESICWDVESDMYLRDAVLNDYVVPLNYLYGFLAYKEGARVINYLAKRYGRRKIGEILGKGQIHITADKTLKAAIGRNQEELYEDWLNLKKREYFPEFGIRKRPEDIAEQLTSREESGGYYNVMPSFSPDGHRVAFVSDRSDYLDLYIRDVITGATRRVARGQRSGEAVTFHPFRSRPGWSTKGEYLAYSRASGGRDEIVIRETEDWDIHRVIRPAGVEEISSPAFMPGDTALAFGALAGDQADIYLKKIGPKSARRLTNDRWDDRFPSFSPDGRYLAFASDRPIAEPERDFDLENYSGESAQMSAQPGEPEDYPFGNYNIWILDLEADTLHPLTTDGLGNDQPSWSPSGKKTAYTSERNGVRNIWIADLDSDTHLPYTDLLSGAFSPTWDSDSKKLIFSAFYDGGFDLYYYKELAHLDSLEPTPFFLSRDTLCDYAEYEGSASDFSDISGDMKKYNFRASGSESEELPPPEQEDEEYTPEFSVDLVTGALGYDTYYGFMGQTYLMFSDMLGNHRILLITDLLDDLENSTVFARYDLLKYRTDFAITGYHYMDYFWDNRDILFSDRVYGGSAEASYPFSQFERVQASAQGFVVQREFLGAPAGTPLPEDISPFNLKFSAAVVKDNSLWKSTGPLNGTRAKLALEYVPPVSENSLDFVAARFDYRKYVHLGEGYGLALRAAAGTAQGDKPPVYWMGGTEYWLNWKLATTDVYSLRDIYFSRMVLPLRGHEYFAYSGQSYAICNLELRYPFVKRLSLGMPPLEIGGINGALFADIGAVAGEDLDDFRGWKNGGFEDVKMGVGVGARAWFWMFLFKYDLAWRTDLRDVAAKPYHHLSLGAEF